MKAKKNQSIHINIWLKLIEIILLRYINISMEWVQQVKNAASYGPVIFVLRNRNLIDFLCLRGICRRFDLPAPGFVSGISPFLYFPLWRYILHLFKGKKNRTDALHKVLNNGGSGIIFLRRPAIRGTLGSRPVAENGILTAAQVYKQKNTPFVVLPTVFLWGEKSMGRTRGNLSFLLGSTEYPRLFHSIFLLIRRRSAHEIISAQPIRIKELGSKSEYDTLRLQGILRARIGRCIELQRRRRLGSFTKPSARIQDQVLFSQRLKKELEAIAKEEKIPTNEITRRCRKILLKLAADFKPAILFVFATIMNFVWKKLYNDLEISKEDVNIMREQIAQGPLLILPCHRSHIDYLAISETMNSANIMLPHIAAGDNLSFWPLGFIFRSAGAFFIRRSFINDKFYTAIVNAYIRRLIHENYAIEVFIEGGRSRTGKLLRPKTGLIEMALDAMISLPGKNPRVLPVFIGYDKVIEESSYFKEARGKKKKKESVAGLLKSIALLKNKYGNLYVKIGESFSLEDVIIESEKTIDDLKELSIKRDIALKVGTRALCQINKNTIVTMSSIFSNSLLDLSPKPLEKEELEKDCLLLLNFLSHTGALLSKESEAYISRPKFELNKNKSLGFFLNNKRITLNEKQEIILNSASKIKLDYYKNLLAHFFAPVALAGVLILDKPQREIRASLKAIPEELLEFFKWEFILFYKNNAKDNFCNCAIDALLKNQIALLKQDGSVVLTNPALLKRIIITLRKYFEVYHCALVTYKHKALKNDDSPASLMLSLQFKENLAKGIYQMAEGKNKLVQQSALNAVKDLKLNRYTQQEHPFTDGESGDRLIKYLDTALYIINSKFYISQN